MTADDRYSLLNIDNFTQPIQIPVSQKQKTFSQFFSAFLKCKLNFEHFQSKYGSHSPCISEITAPAKSDSYISKNSRLIGPFNNQHGKRAQTNLQAGRQSLYHIY